MSAALSQRERGRQARHRRLRKRVVGLPERPRLCVFRSHKHLYAQLIDDVAGKTIRGWSTKDERLKHAAHGGTVPAATELGSLIAGDLAERGIRRIVFDRGGYRYHGRVQAVAEAARAGGLEV